MSGICAVWRKDNSARAQKRLAAISSGLSITNAERVDERVDRNVGLAVSARFATQQVYESPGTLVACDADLLNENELDQWRNAGEPAGGTANTAALISALYERFGSDFVSKLRGSFSILIWDRRQKKLLAAVDRFGINRLAYYDDGKVLLVASRIDALMRSGDIDAAVNPRGIASVLNFSTVLGPETIFTAVHRVPPGALLIVSEHQTHVEKYWDMQYGLENGGHEARLSRELESLVEASVAAHCKREAAHEIGAFLSGGTDSSTVVGMMSQMKNGPVKAFSIGFEEQRFNELQYAEIAAGRFSAIHYKYLVSPQDCFEALPDMVRCFDEPFANSSAIPTYFCARLAAQNGVKTLLAGDGGDELFGGNERYVTDKVFEAYRTVPAVLRGGLIEPILAWLPMQGGVIRKARGYIRRAKMPSVERFLSFQFLSAHPPSEIFETGFLEKLKDYSILEVPSRYYSQAPGRDHLDRLLYVDVKITLGDSDLPKVTCMAELAGAQARFPLLDTAVAEFSGRIPANLKVKGFQKRYLFKRAFRNLLPGEIIGKKKHGFGIPVSLWLKSDPRLKELARDTLRSKRASERGYFRPGFIEGLFQKHTTHNSSYYGDVIWSFLVLELWHQFMDAPAKLTVSRETELRQTISAHSAG